ncbi:MAG: response regulator [Anaerolineales bacterium]|jgi:DNA-binding response OmpR family regulator
MALILFVDDDPYTLVTLTKAVEVLGHQAITASTIKEAFILASEKSPDLIFTDMRLSDKVGTTLISQLKSQESTANIPTFVLSASPDVTDVSDVRDVGAIAYLDKPIRLDTLLTIIEEYAAS